MACLAGVSSLTCALEVSQTIGLRLRGASTKYRTYLPACCQVAVQMGPSSPCLAVEEEGILFMDTIIILPIKEQVQKKKVWTNLSAHPATLPQHVRGGEADVDPKGQIEAARSFDDPFPCQCC